MLTASFRTASCDAASTTKSTGFEESRCELATTSGFCLSFETRLSACDLSMSYTWVSVAGIFAESIASAIWVPIAPQPNRPIHFKSIKRNYDYK